MKTTRAMMNPTVIVVHMTMWRGTVQASLGWFVWVAIAIPAEQPTCHRGRRGFAQDLRGAMTPGSQDAEPARSAPGSPATSRHAA